MSDKISIFDKTIFRERLKEVSNNKSWSAIQEECDISQSLSKLTSTKYKEYPSIDVLLRIANQYGCTIDYLIGHDTSNQLESKKSLTFRDLCKVIIQIDEYFQPDIDEKKYSSHKFINPFGFVEDSDKITGIYPYMTISFKPDPHEYTALIPAYDEETNTKYYMPHDMGSSTRGYISVNHFIKKYLTIKSLRNDLDNEQYELLINNLLNKVPNDSAPYPEEVFDDSDFSAKDFEDE